MISSLSFVIDSIPGHSSSTSPNDQQFSTWYISSSISVPTISKPDSHVVSPPITTLQPLPDYVPPVVCDCSQLVFKRRWSLLTSSVVAVIALLFLIFHVLRHLAWGVKAHFPSFCIPSEVALPPLSPVLIYGDASRLKSHLLDPRLLSCISSCNADPRKTCSWHLHMMTGWKRCASRAALQTPLSVRYPGRPAPSLILRTTLDW